MLHDLSDIAGRLDRVESRDAIRQLAFKYALAIDMRDVDAIVNLYVENVKISKEESGRQALKRVFAAVVRSFSASVHHVGNQVIEFDDPDNAHGVTYCRCEHEVDDQWVPMYLYYLDIYKRVDGVWLFKRRAPCELYGVVSTMSPAGPKKVRWPGRQPHDGTWHAHFPSWKAFWENPDADAAPVGPAAPPERFIDQIRRGDRRVIPPDFSWADKKQ